MYNKLKYKKYFLLIIVALVIGASVILVLRYRNANEGAPIGGERDSHGCLNPAGYAFDDEVGACIRAFEMTSDIKNAAEIAVKKVGRSYALTVVSFNSYEEVGAYDITLEQGAERKRETVYIKNWQAVSVISSMPISDTQRAIQDILAKKYNRPPSEVKVTIDREVQGFAGGSVLFGQGGLGEGGMWLAVLGNGWSVVWDGNGNVDCNKMRREYGFPDTILKPDFCD